MGVFSKDNEQYFPAPGEPVKRTSAFNDQFILCSKQLPHGTLLNSTSDSNTLLCDDIRDRVSSFSSQRTDDSDDHTSSLHALSDEQLGHLTSVYHPFSSEAGMPSPSRDASHSTLSDSMLY